MASTFGNILQRAGLTSPKRKKRRTTPYSEPFSEVTAPNQLWCMDFKGYFVSGDGSRCDPFTITDACSRYLIRCQIVSRMDLSRVRAICEVFRFEILDFEQVDEDFYKVYFRDVEIGEFDAQALRFRPVQVMR